MTIGLIRLTARCKTAIWIRCSIVGNLLIRSDIKQSCSFIFRGWRECLTTWMILKNKHETINILYNLLSFLNHLSFDWILTNTLFTSAVWPKNVCFGFPSLKSHNLDVLSTEPVTKVFLSGDSEIETWKYRNSRSFECSIWMDFPFTYHITTVPVHFRCLSTSFQVPNANLHVARSSYNVSVIKESAWA